MLEAPESRPTSTPAREDWPEPVLPAQLATAIVRVLANSAWLSFLLYLMSPSFGRSDARVIGVYFAGSVLFETGLALVAWWTRRATR